MTVFHLTGPSLLVSTLAAGALFQGIGEGVRDVAYYLRRYNRVTSRAPAGPGVRHSSRPTPRGPAMPDDDDVTRIGHGPAYGWTPPEQPVTQGFPAPGRKQPNRRGLMAGLVALLATIAVLAAALVGYLLWSTSSTAPAAVQTTMSTANADGCRQFDEAMKSMADALTNATPAPFFIFGGAQDIEDKVPTVAELTTGDTRAAMLKMVTWAKLLAAKEQQFMWKDFDPAPEVSGLQNAYERVQALCSDAGIALTNAPYTS